MRRGRRAGLYIAVLAIGVVAASTLGAALLGVERGIVVIVHSVPSGATVFWGDGQVGMTPMRLTMSAGERQALRFVRRDHMDEVVFVDADAMMPSGLAGRSRMLLQGAEKQLTVRLTRAANATLVVTTKPKGAQVFLDGNRLGATPLVKEGVVPGSHVLHITRKNSFPLTETVVIGVGEDNRIHRVLKSKVVALYAELIAKQPGKLTHHAELGHYYVLEGEFAKAAEALRGGLAALKRSDASDQSRYVLELYRIYVRQYHYPEETEENKIHPACRELLQSVLDQSLYNEKKVRHYLKAMDAHAKSQGW